MKKMQMLSVLLALTIFSGCGAAQAETEATSVNQAMLIERSSQKQESYTFPERFTGDWISQEGKLSIHADAKVAAEQGVVLPTATVTPRQFSQADVDNLLKVFLKGAPLYDNVLTKQQLRESLEYVSSPEWKSNPDGPKMTQEELEAQQKNLIAYYQTEIERAPEEKPMICGFSDSHDPEKISGTATVDGMELFVSIRRYPGYAKICRKGYENRNFSSNTQEYPSEEEALAQADALMEALGFDNMVCDDVQPFENGVLRLYYVPTVNGIHLSSIREDYMETDGTRSHYQYWDYSASDEKDPDTVSWVMENIQIYVGKDGIYSFEWQSPSAAVAVKEEHTALLPFEEIASIADTMLPVVIIGPTEAHSLADLDHINGYDTNMDVSITKVSLTLMRVRDKGTEQGTIIPVWDFWGTWNWYDADGQNEEKHSYTVQPMLTLNAIDGSVVNRVFGY